MTTLVDFPVKPEARPYVDAFEQGLGHDPMLGPPWLAQARQRALRRFAEIGFPTRRRESWRYLNLQSLEQAPLLPIDPWGGADVDANAYTQFAELDLPPSRFRFVIVDGLAVGKLSTTGWQVDGPIWLGPIPSALINRQQLVPVVVSGLRDDIERPFAALNEAFFAEGYILDIAPGVVLDEPVEIVHLATGAVEASFHTRNLVNLAAGARATIIETYLGEGKYWRNDVASWQLGEGASLTRIALVEESAAAVHFGEVAATLAASAKLEAFSLLLGGGTVRHEVNVAIAGEKAECRIDGAFVVSGQEEANVVTTIDHAAVGGTTRELIKGVAAGRGHGAFQGKIIVREGAQQTDARQTSRNIILGRRASIDTKPELEILADDVKCAHGASVGELDEAALFYLRARGIPIEEARRLLIEGFLREPIEGIADPAIREHLLRRLSLRLARLEDS
jgi:Fe-S cluster assembly protein SufD